MQHHHNPILEHFHHLNKTFHPHLQLILIATRAPGNHESISCLYRFTFSGHFCINEYGVLCVWLPSPDVCEVSHTLERGWRPHSLLLTHCVPRYGGAIFLLNCSPINGRLGRLYFMAGGNPAAMNIYMQVLCELCFYFPWVNTTSGIFFFFLVI